MKRRKGRRTGGVRRDKRKAVSLRRDCRLTAVVVATVAASLGFGGPAWALWSQSLSLPIYQTRLGTVAFAVKGQNDPAKTVSQAGEPVTVEISSEQIEAAYANPTGGVPMYSFTVTGWADGTYGLDYALDAKLSGPAVAQISRQVLVSRECTTFGTLPWWREDGYIDFAGYTQPFELQPIGHPHEEATVHSDKWCVAFPINAGQYVNHAEATGHWIDENNTFLQVAGEADWNTNLIRTPDTVKGAHLTITATPIPKGK